MNCTTVLGEEIKFFCSLFLSRGDKNVKIVLKRIVENGLDNPGPSRPCAYSLLKEAQTALNCGCDKTKPEV